MSKTQWLQFVIGLVIGLSVLWAMPSDNSNCSRLASIAGACNGGE